MRFASEPPHVTARDSIVLAPQGLPQLNIYNLLVQLPPPVKIQPEDSPSLVQTYERSTRIRRGFKPQGLLWWPWIQAVHAIVIAWKCQESGPRLVDGTRRPHSFVVDRGRRMRVTLMDKNNYY